jgi:hypothetical protein
MGGSEVNERLPAPWRPVEVEQFLASRLGPVALSFTASACLLAVMPGPGSTLLRLSPEFLYAPVPVLEALAVHARSPYDLTANDLLDAWLRAPRRPDGSDDRGRCHDLDAILTEINERFFEGRVRARIGWSRGAAQRRRRSILFGSYFRAPGEEVGTIKIHPALDEDWVPRGFVEFVVHHEVLHAVIPTRCVDGRRAFHPPEFRRRERLYPEFVRWRRWEKENLGRFLGKVISASS